MGFNRLVFNTQEQADAWKRFNSFGKEYAKPWIDTRHTPTFDQQIELLRKWIKKYPDDVPFVMAFVLEAVLES